jgi:hypothetical protein
MKGCLHDPNLVMIIPVIKTAARLALVGGADFLHRSA